MKKRSNLELAIISQNQSELAMLIAHSRCDFLVAEGWHLQPDWLQSSQGGHSASNGQLNGVGSGANCSWGNSAERTAKFGQIRLDRKIMRLEFLPDSTFYIKLLFLIPEFEIQHALNFIISVEGPCLLPNFISIKVQK